MNKLVFFLAIAICVAPLYAQTEEQIRAVDYITVEFNQTTPDSGITWTNADLNATLVRSTATSSSGTVSDTYTSGGYYWTDYTTTTTTVTTTTTTITTQTSVMLTVTFTDFVNAQGAFDPDSDFDSLWYQAWDYAEGGTNINRTFQIREDSKAQVQAGVNQLEGLYDDLFVLQNKIAAKIDECESYRSAPEQDAQHPGLFDELAKLRQEEYQLKGEIITVRNSVLNEQGDGLLGWNVNVTNDVDTDTNRISTTDSVRGGEVGCFVAGTKMNGTTLEKAWSENMSVSAGKLMRTGHYTGMVFMFYDAAGNTLLPGSVTPNHGIVTTDAVKRAEYVEVGDTLVLGTGETATVGKVETVQYNGYIYNISNGKKPYTFSASEVVTVGVPTLEGDRIDKSYTFEDLSQR